MEQELEISDQENEIDVAKDIERKYNKLLNVEISPHVDIILTQHYLNILGGDCNNPGLVTEIELFEENNADNSNDLFDKIKNTYEKYLNHSKDDSVCSKYHLELSHTLQNKSRLILDDDETQEFDQEKHITLLKNEIVFFENEKKLTSDYYLGKFLENQVDILNYQIESIMS